MSRFLRVRVSSPIGSRRRAWPTLREIACLRPDEAESSRPRKQGVIAPRSRTLSINYILEFVAPTMRMPAEKFPRRGGAIVIRSESNQPPRGGDDRRAKHSTQYLLDASATDNRWSRSAPTRFGRRSRIGRLSDRNCGDRLAMRSASTGEKRSREAKTGVFLWHLCNEAGRKVGARPK